jgi:hypothetical protein
MVFYKKGSDLFFLVGRGHGNEFVKEGRGTSGYVNEFSGK